MIKKLTMTWWELGFICGLIGAVSFVAGGLIYATN